MRTLTLFTASLVLVLGLSFSASADPTVDMLWTGSSGAGTTGGSSISGAVGDTLTLTVIITTDAGGLSNGAQSFLWDGGGTSVLDFSSSTAVTAWPIPAPGTTLTQTGGQSGGGQAGTHISGGSTGSFLAASTTVTQGTLVFVITGTGSTTVNAGLFRTGVDDYCNNAASFTPCTQFTATTWNAASVNVVPEPGTAALIALGLGALTLAGRRRKA